MQGIGANRRRRVIIEIAFLLLLIALIAVDQITKYHFSHELTLYEVKPVIKDFFYFSYTINTGAAWSFLVDATWGQTFFKILTAFALVVFLAMYIYSVKKGYKWLKVSLIFLIGGTLGNFIDRISINGVIDFIGFTFGEYNFPIFNLADTFLVVGVIMLIIQFLFIDKNAVFKRENASKDI